MAVTEKASAKTIVIPGGPSAFDSTIHKPPRIDHFGYNKETHKGRELLNRNAKNILCEEVNIPNWWATKKIRDNRFRSTIFDEGPSRNNDRYNPERT